MTIMHPISSVPEGLPLALEDVTCAFGSVVALDHITCPARFLPVRFGD